MKFAVPQFIDVEDKLFGALTLKQGVYLAGGAGFAVFVYVLTNFFFAALLGLPVILFAVALAFVRINNRPFIFIVESALYYTTKRKLYLWKKTPHLKASTPAVDESTASAKTFVPRLSENKLKELAWSLDIKESMYESEQAYQRPTA